MTRKDFVLIATILNEYVIRANDHGNDDDSLFMTYLCCSFADELALTNKQFNRARFLKACGIDQ